MPTLMSPTNLYPPLTSIIRIEHHPQKSNPSNSLCYRYPTTKIIVCILISKKSYVNAINELVPNIYRRENPHPQISLYHKIYYLQISNTRVVP